MLHLLRDRSFRSLLAILIVSVSLACGSDGRESQSAEARHLSAADMEEAIEAASKLPSIHERILRFAEVMDRLDPENAEGLGRALEKVMSSMNNIELQWLMSRWAEIDPVAAFDSAMRWKLESKRMVGVTAVAYEWARSGHAVEGRNYVESLEQIRVKGPAVRGLVSGWAKSDDLAGLTDFVLGNSKIGAREKLTELLVNSILSTQGIEGVMSWVDSVPIDAPGHYKRTAYKKALRQIANRDPRAAAAWYESQKDTDYARRSPSVIGGEWAEHDPEEALAWILSQPEGRERRVALQRWTARWASYDRAGLEEWMENADFTRKEIAEIPSHYITSLLPGLPQMAAPWVEKIPDEALRMEAAKKVARMWIRFDPKATEEFLARHGVSEDSLDSPRGPRRRSGSQQGSTKSDSQTLKAEADPISPTSTSDGMRASAAGGPP